MELYYPSVLAKYNIKDLCPLCNSYLDIKTQYLYMKKYKDECSICMKYNNMDCIYCLCECSEDYTMKTKMITCNNCNMYPKKTKKSNYNEIADYNSAYSYKYLYKMARDKKIKYRSLMSKDELYVACNMCA